MATNPAQLARLRKEAHPEQYCTHKGCLWRVAGPRGPNPCRNHPVAVPRIDFDELVRSVTDRLRVYIAAESGWNHRQQEDAREEAYDRSEWLADFQAGDHV